MLEITRNNYYKCNLETVTLNDSQYFWININIWKQRSNEAG